MIGFADQNPLSNLPHFYSIGRNPTSSKADNALYSLMEGAKAAYKHQQVIEYIPFYTASADTDPLNWAHVPHFLRVSPAWEGGNLAAPYPIHLARALLNDLEAVLKPY